ncbi:MAG: hypothetical protein GW762_04230 [Candidatus Pacebacteria bacterium]|nr:hypothetical protein [Candidatus Paceibacterota bacterium]PIR63987.1 MAG: hypothetical protein COU64_01650 [Candidatus Pacebacteria bacterium CG10_big_fil_rev_8_21_14_0_10_40_26]PIZ79086.1 MAG: hypothetical protein COY01_01515 [Candidatus Pacebacteria bacterium CG_4_10_14_0_2_um_filter_40_20]PJA69226.1 MAG: hypothetical protein CO156_01320 [Candidatus Pacebacteria bacterium CG_4_9_14_3_um_filter_40_12]PJC42052.1 MAG: hypothetical protein CO041_00225 [Candidatus Pacebacteria bacterium CG_4_9_
MRRREKFVIAAILLSFGLLGVQVTALDFRYWAVLAFFVVTYLVSSWALHDDLQPHERLTIVPFPALYAVSVSLFYFLLPPNVLSRILLLVFFGVGMYAIYLTANIFSVAKGRTIQLVHAAQAISLIVTLVTSLLLSNTVFSLKFPFFLNGLFIGVLHFPLIFTSLWSVNLEQKIQKETLQLSTVLALILAEVGVIISFFPLSVWYDALFVMSLLYIGVGILQAALKGRLFTRTLTEYSLVALFIALVFAFVVPLK